MSFITLEFVIQSISITLKRPWILVAGALMSLCAATNVAAANVTLVWDRSPDSNVSGYRVYYGLGSRTYPFAVDAGNATEQVIGNLQDGITYYFAVTAYTVDHESDFSGEIPYTVPLRGISALEDGSFRIRFRGIPGVPYRVQYTESLSAPNWLTLDTYTADATGALEIIDLPEAGSPKRFYRTVYP
jgi:hypothetical protein